MEEWAKWIVDNPFLQALSIIVAIGTLIIFLISTVPTILTIIIDSFTIGVKKAYLKALRPTIMRSQESYDDSRLIALWISHLTLRFFARLFIFFLVLNMISDLVSLNKPGVRIVLDRNDIVSSILVSTISLVMAVLTSVYIMNPFFALWNYLIFTRRKILRGLGRLDRFKKSGTP